jgi:hypothetical protein
MARARLAADDIAGQFRHGGKWPPTMREVALARQAGRLTRQVGAVTG